MDGEYYKATLIYRFIMGGEVLSLKSVIWSPQLLLDTSEHGLWALDYGVRVMDFGIWTSDNSPKFEYQGV